MLTWKPGQQYCGNIRVFDPSLHVDGTGLVVYHNDVRRNIGDRKYEIVTGMPCSNILPVSNVAIDVDVFFSAIAVDEYHSNFNPSHRADSQVKIKVVERPADEGLVNDCTALDRLLRGNEVRELSST